MGKKVYMVVREGWFGGSEENKTETMYGIYATKQAAIKAAERYLHREYRDHGPGYLATSLSKEIKKLHKIDVHQNCQIGKPNSWLQKV